MVYTIQNTATEWDSVDLNQLQNGLVSVFVYNNNNIYTASLA